MRNKNNSTFFKTLLGICVLLVFNLAAFPKFVGNYTEEAYQEPAKTQVRLNIIDAAGYFLKSQSDMLLLLNKIELGDSYGVNFPELRDILTNAISNMENAKTKYAELVQLTKTTPYNQTVIDNLINFDYDSFQQKNEFNSVIADKVRDYLSTGDVNGVYSKLLSDSQGILDRLYSIQSDLNTDTIPTNFSLWRINQSFSETLLFGQYVAEIFSDIPGK
jgi:hypothetical protein